jgi:hypothetical protein
MGCSEPGGSARLQSLPLVRRVAELGSVGGTEIVAWLFVLVLSLGAGVVGEFEHHSCSHEFWSHSFSSVIGEATRRLRWFSHHRAVNA